jgi:reverse gyrase
MLVIFFILAPDTVSKSSFRNLIRIIKGKKYRKTPYLVPGTTLVLKNFF